MMMREVVPAALLLVGVLWPYCAATAAYLPRSYYRFEDATALMKDSAPAALDLQPRARLSRLLRANPKWKQEEQAMRARNMAARRTMIPDH